MGILFVCMVLAALVLLAICSQGLIVRSYSKIPVLMYHRVNDTMSNRFTVSRIELEKHLHYLHQNGYHSITAGPLIDFLDNKISLPPKPVLITFDDEHIDLSLCFRFFYNYQITFAPAFAYPHGTIPKDKTRLRLMEAIFNEMGIKLAFRIGNNMNPLNLRDHYAVERIEIRGNDPCWLSILKLKQGRAKLFELFR